MNSRDWQGPLQKEEGQVDRRLALSAVLTTTIMLLCWHHGASMPESHCATHATPTHMTLAHHHHLPHQRHWHRHDGPPLVCSLAALLLLLAAPSVSHDTGASSAPLHHEAGWLLDAPSPVHAYGDYAKLSSGDDSFFYRKGASLLQDGQRDKALGFFEKARGIRPDSAATQNNLAVVRLC